MGIGLGHGVAGEGVTMADERARAGEARGGTVTPDDQGAVKLGGAAETPRCLDPAQDLQERK